ncbi:hypothetical protein SDC9_114483 [bioreactor metagenome]|uniref:ABC transmembrane type-1 domain-containing protein n=1 Tax=bioreactor metagenome TaxID=1076179 RepID=A0A645BQ32_9ZZZZ
MPIFYKIQKYLKKPHNLILVMMVIVLGYLTLLPMLSMLKDTVTVHNAEAMRLKLPVGAFTWAHWKKVLFDSSSISIFYKPFLNSLITSLGACAVALVLGGTFSWLVTRTNMKWKSALSSLCIFPYIMPSWTLALAWYNIFKNDVVGGVPGLFSALTGLRTPNWLAYGPFPIALVTGLHYAPFAYIMIGGILRNMDANLEEAAMMLNTPRSRIIRKITIPMVIPAILSTFLLVFSSAMSSFAVPTFLGLPVRYTVLTTQLYRTLNGLNPGQGYCIALIMIILGVSILAMNQRITGIRKNYTTVTGKSSNISLINLRRLRTPISVAVAVVLVCVSILPLISFALESIIFYPGNYSPSTYTLQFWIGSAEQNSIANSEPGLLLNPRSARKLI